MLQHAVSASSLVPVAGGHRDTIIQVKTIALWSILQHSRAMVVVVVVLYDEGCLTAVTSMNSSRGRVPALLNQHDGHHHAGRGGECAKWCLVCSLRDRTTAVGAKGLGWAIGSLCAPPPLRVPADMSAMVQHDYFDGASPPRRPHGNRLDGPEAGRTEGRAGSLDDTGLEGGDDAPAASSVRSRARNTDNVVEISVLAAKVRRTDTSFAWFDATPDLADGAQVSSHMNLELDFNVSHCVRGSTQNCLFEWKTARQAREELDQYGRPLKMLNIELFEDSAVDAALSGYRIDVGLRPLRCCASWDLVDFLKLFCSNFVSLAAESVVPVRNGDGMSDITGPILLCGDVRGIYLKIDLDTRLAHLDAIRRGDMQELLKLFTLAGVELQLQPVSCRDVELSGFSDIVLQSWLRDITSSQLHKFLAGTGPMRPLSAVGYNAANVVLLPLQQYRQGGRVMHGLRRGAAEFVKSVTLESIHASSKISRYIASSLHYLAETTPARRYDGMTVASRQPANVRSGLLQAQDSLRAGVNLAAHAVIAIPLEDPVKGAIRAVPIAVLAPVIGAAEAVSYTLLGMRNAMNPDLRHDEERKYKTKP